ncbi:2Fe-2S iron-sulfur cluster binding domain-containing protein [Polycladidibacter hongkongensis]|uniref:2Fe-2S iron-sulfur cluster binding domain-containing protein n=1 Tax=Polycladidibacter hongkongensis TaxID=1647556 RepID=UPI0008369E70|nr:2Fe-2S iron-sulfur cluster binding domain-containing protein [Pseudovibrio hongkongensis]
MVTDDLKLIVNGTSITAEADELIANVIQRSKAPFEPDCLGAFCEGCRVQLVHGRVNSQAPIHRGRVLACAATLECDSEIYIEPAPKVGSIRGHVDSAISLHSELSQIQLVFERPLAWIPGQYFKLLPRGLAPLRLYPSFTLDGGTEFSSLIFLLERGNNPSFETALERGRFAEGKPMRLEGPFGTSFLRREEERLVTICGRGGFSAAWAIAVNSAYGLRERPKTFIFDQLYQAPSFARAFSWLAEHDVAYRFANLSSRCSASFAQNLLAAEGDLNEFDCVHATGSFDFFEKLRSALATIKPVLYLIPSDQALAEAEQLSNMESV